MRLLHTADWHLGQDFYNNSRHYEHDCFLTWLLDQIRLQDADCLVIAGDIFDSINPPLSAISQFYAFLQQAMAQKDDLHIIIVAGNHDSGTRLELPKPLLDRDHIHIVGNLPRQDQTIDLDRLILPLDTGKATPFQVFTVPFIRNSELVHLGIKSPQDLGELYRELAKKARAISAEGPVIATGHLNIQGGMASEFSEKRILIGGEEAAPAGIFPEQIDYVALGHLHRPQTIKGACMIAYSGSPFPMSMAEKDYKHSICLVEFDGDNHPNLTRIPTPRPIEFLRHPNKGGASLAELLSFIESLPDQDCGKERWPFLELGIDDQRSMTQARYEIQEALRDKHVRLTRIQRANPSSVVTLSEMEDAPELSDLRPDQVFTTLLGGHSLEDKDFQALQVAFQHLWKGQ